MSKKIFIGIGIVGVLIIAGIVAYVLRPSAEASTPIEAIPVSGDGSAVKETASPTQASASADTSSTSEGAIVFTIMQAESEVRFTLNEVLSGVPTTVVGVSDQVAGEIAVDPATPANSKVGVILVNARTLATDNNFRNRAINNEILQTDEYEFIRFTPTAMTGFPENPKIGEELKFQITGDLTIRDITNQVTFDVTAMAVSETRLEGHASTTIARADYGLKIPNVPRVANVDEEVLLEIDFAAVSK